MNLAIDIGNTTVKVAVFDGQELVYYEKMEGHGLDGLEKLSDDYFIERCIVSSTVNVTDEMKSRISAARIGSIIYFDSATRVPVKNLYRTPNTLGTDRLAAAVGAYCAGKGRDTLVVDMGTAITYELVTAQGEYLGGNISPGIEMRLKALHEFTAKLPKVDRKGEKPFWGRDTETAIRCGVLDGVRHEIEGFIKELIVKYPYLVVFLTGGNIFDFDSSIKKRIFVDRYIVLKGLNRILNDN
ncbi:MAG: type III pantothenate kinase [Bacteroides sp.]|nr:type III pantothenate kinase [Roseburia sp.]MCM1346785.1 type III pantothenate kinase [Bacteroides sp.]MCM1421017.1 type III pantothenate kinase [Bacteroides sp.]